MSSKKNIDSEKALKELEKLIRRIVRQKEQLAEFEKILSESRNRKTVPIRGIHQKLMQYRKKYSVYEPFTQYEKEFIQDLFDYWG